MSKVFQIIPKRIKRVNGIVLTPEMVVTVGFDYKKACCSVNDFEFKKLD